MRREIEILMTGTPVVRIKLYDLNGLTAFSTRPLRSASAWRLIPTRKRNSPAFAPLASAA